MRTAAPAAATATALAGPGASLREPLLSDDAAADAALQLRGDQAVVEAGEARQDSSDGAHEYPGEAPVPQPDSSVATAALAAARGTVLAGPGASQLTTLPSDDAADLSGLAHGRGGAPQPALSVASTSMVSGASTPGSFAAETSTSDSDVEYMIIPDTDYALDLGEMD